MSIASAMTEFPRSSGAQCVHFLFKLAYEATFNNNIAHFYGGQFSVSLLPHPAERNVYILFLNLLISNFK